MEDHSATPARVLFHQGEQHVDAAAWALAEQAFRQALALEPGFAEAQANLGYVRDLQGDSAEAEACYRGALELNPDAAVVHLNLGALLARQKRHTEAEGCYAAALALEPDSSAVWSNLGALNLNLQREETAEACLRHAMALDPTNARPRFNLAYLQLRRGQLEEGWSLLEARSGLALLEQQIQLPRWQGDSLAGKSLLVVAEAGHGDTIHFCRYVVWLKEQGARHISLVCPPALVALLQTLAGVDCIYAYDEAFDDKAHDDWLPLLSAPGLAHAHGCAQPVGLPYLKSDAERRKTWATLLPTAPGLRVGLVWKGNADFENDSDRSLGHFQWLEPLWTVDGLCFVSLQKGNGEQEPSQCASTQPATEIGPLLNDFADAAAVIDQLDLVISVDTAIAHLAGALGKPCWLLLPWYMPDWRWRAQGNETPWYPGAMRLFRQQSDGDWSGVVQEVTQALQTHVATA